MSIYDIETANPIPPSNGSALIREMMQGLLFENKSDRFSLEIEELNPHRINQNGNNGLMRWKEVCRFLGSQEDAEEMFNHHVRKGNWRLINTYTGDIILSSNN